MIFLYGMESTLFFHLCFIDFPSLPPTFSLCQLLTQPLLLPTRYGGRERVSPAFDSGGPGTGLGSILFCAWCEKEDKSRAVDLPLRRDQNEPPVADIKQ